MIDEAEMRHLMKLARLDLTPDEADSMRADLNKILGYFEKLSELDTAGVEEMQRPVALENVLRDDVPTLMFSREQALALAVETQDGLFKVPRTVDQ